MRAVVLDTPGSDFLVEEVEPVPPSGDDVVVRTGVGMCCLTDAIQRADGGGLVDPHVRGHTGVGVVTAVGPDVTRLQVGQRVLAPTRPQCERCWFCRNGQAQFCTAGDVPGPYVARRADGTLMRGSARVGSFAETMKVREVQLVPIESDIPDEHLAVLGCSGGGGLGAILNSADVDSTTTVTVVGAGLYGLSAIQGARIAGATRIIAVDPVASRREVALRLGATHAVDPTTDDPGAAVRELTEGRGACVSLEAVGRAEAQLTAFDATRRGGQVVLGGFGARADMVPFRANQLAMSGKQVIGSQWGDVHVLRDLPAWTRFIESGDFDAASLVSGTYPLEEINQVLDKAETQSLLGACIG